MEGLPRDILAGIGGFLEYLGGLELMVSEFVVDLLDGLHS